MDISNACEKYNPNLIKEKWKLHDNIISSKISIEEVVNIITTLVEERKQTKCHIHFLIYNQIIDSLRTTFKIPLNIAEELENFNIELDTNKAICSKTCDYF